MLDECYNNATEVLNMQTIVNYIAKSLQARIPRIKIDTAIDTALAHLTIPNKHG